MFGCLKNIIEVCNSRLFPRLPWLALVFAMGCQPKGQYQRQIHPPFQTAPNKTNPKLPIKAADSDALALTNAGLPPQCQLENRSASVLCIQCEFPDSQLERCYAFRGQLEPLKGCVYSSDRLKCLNRNPPFAINIGLRSTLEKQLLEQFDTWKVGLRSIAISEVSEIQKSELNQAIDWTDRMLRELIRLRGKEPWANPELLARLGSGLKTPEQMVALSELLEKLQGQRLSGQLKLIQVLRASRIWLSSAGYSEPILGYWEALSLEGLEDEN